mmetsp:Transcript_20052/g.17742  ORF Transcript_20052/g.17742 Transcript_20052/m.17742 type:complete len:203 (+) Transcript_20052:336-944(+)
MSIEEENDLAKELRGAFTTPRQSLPNELRELMQPGFIHFEDKQSTVKRHQASNLPPQDNSQWIDDNKHNNVEHKGGENNELNDTQNLGKNKSSQPKRDSQLNETNIDILKQKDVKNEESKEGNALVNLSLAISKKKSKEPRSKSVAINSTEKSNRTTIFKSKHLELSEKLSDGFVSSKRGSGFNLVIDFSDLHFSLKNDLIA